MGSINKLRILLLIAIIFTATLISNAVFAQKCPQANITATNYELRKQDGTPFLITDNYTVGQTQVDGKIFVKLGGSTTSGYNLTMVYDIYVNGAPQVLRKQSCLFIATSIVQGVFVEVTDFSWIWGNKIEIKNIFITWTTGTPKENTTCSILTQEDIDSTNSQCYFSSAGFTAVTPLYPRFDYTTTCGSNTVSFTNNTSGGATPYTYSWNFAGQGTSILKDPSFTFSQPGSYSVSLTVKDSQTPTQTETTVNQVVIIPSQLGISVTSTPTQINGSTGSINVTVSGGTAPYTYLWTYPNGSTRTTEDISSLAKGTYSLMVTDSQGCTQTAQYNVYDLLTPDFTYIPGPCNNNVTFTSTTAGGTPPFNYTYSWDFNNDGTTDSSSANPKYDFPGSGKYPVKLTVSDGYSSMTQTKDVFIDPNFGIQVTIFPTKENESSGIIYVESVTGGTPEYSYSWVGPNGFTSTSKDIFNLSNGLYSLTVTDSNGCTQTVEYTLDIAMVLNVTWTSIEVKEVDERIGLSWEMSSEKDDTRYLIERSLKDVSQFRTIGEITGRGSSSLPVRYEFTDSTFPVSENLIFYRILLLLDGDSYYSPVKVIRRNNSSELEGHWMVYPNPNLEGRVVLKFVGGRISPGEKVLITAISDGKIIKEFEWSIEGQDEINLDQFLDFIPPGLTLLRIQWDKHVETLKILQN